MRVKCLAQEHNTMSPARARAQTARSGDERTNHEATAPHTLGREHLQRAVSIESLDNFYFSGITLRALFCNSKFNNPELKFGRNYK